MPASAEQDSVLTGTQCNVVCRTHSIRWIAFDAVGTLIFPDPPVAEVYAAAARRCGSRLTAEDIRGRFGAAFARSVADDITREDWGRPDVLRTSEDRERRRWLEIVSCVIDDVHEPAACFQELFSHFARPESWRCYPDVDETLRALAERGYRLAIISNFDNRLNAICDGLPELRRIELRVISSLVGHRKPSAHFYAALVRAAECQPADILVVGDDVINDVEGARAAGTRPVLIDRAGSGSAADGTLTDLRQVLECLPSIQNIAFPDRPDQNQALR